MFYTNFTNYHELFIQPELVKIRVIRGKNKTNSQFFPESIRFLQR